MTIILTFSAIRKPNFLCRYRAKNLSHVSDATDTLLTHAILNAFKTTITWQRLTSVTQVLFEILAILDLVYAKVLLFGKADY